VNPYVVWAGNCMEDEPKAIEPTFEDPYVNVPAGESILLEVPLPFINVKVMSGKKLVEGAAVENASAKYEDGCKAPAKRSFGIFTNKAGTFALPPGLPFGKYSVCASGMIGEKVKEEWHNTVSSVLNNKAAGVTAPTIFLGEGSKGPCP
jgi:hypothetical protein